MPMMPMAVMTMMGVVMTEAVKVVEPFGAVEQL